MYMLNGWWFLSSGGAYPPVFTVAVDNGCWKEGKTTTLLHPTPQKMTT